MKKILAANFAAILAISMTSCIHTDDQPVGSDQLIEEVFELQGFSSVDVGSAMNVVIIESDEFRVTANGAERDINDLNIRVINNTLKIDYYKRNWLRGLNRKRMDLVIETNALREIDASGASLVEIANFNAFRVLDADISGASRLELNVPADELDLELSGASVFTMKENCPVISADLSGASKLYAFDAASEKVYLELSGASKAQVSVSDFLEVEASGASSVVYRGTPRIDQEISGGSKISKD